MRPLTAPQTAPIASATAKTTASETFGWWTYSTPVAYAEIPRTDPIERSTFRVMMTIVSPIASSAMMAEPARICWTFAELRKRWLSIVVAPTTITRASTIPSSRKRARNSANACEPERVSTTPCSWATDVTPPPRPDPSRPA